MFQDMEVVVPELVLDKERHLRTDETKEAPGIADSVEGKITDDIRTLIVLTHLVA